MSKKFEEFASYKTDPKYKRASVIYKVEFLKHDKNRGILYITDDNSIRILRPDAKFTEVEDYENFPPEPSTQAISLKKKTKKNKKKIVPPIVEIMVNVETEPDTNNQILYCLPTTRGEYITQERRRAVSTYIEITDDNINNIDIFTKRVYHMWKPFIRLSFNYNRFFDQEEMCIITNLLDTLYFTEPKFKTQLQFYNNICVVKGIHFDSDFFEVGEHFTGYMINTNNNDRSPMLHFYIEFQKITRITFKQELISELL